MKQSEQVEEQHADSNPAPLLKPADVLARRRVESDLEILFTEALLCIKDMLVAFGLLALLEALDLYIHRAAFDAELLSAQGVVLVPLLALAVPCTYLSVCAHEGGHLLAGRLVGFWFYSCRIRSFSITRTRQRLQFTREPRTRTGGAVVSFPTGDYALRLRQGFFVAGGPLASLLLAALAWLLALGDAACCTSVAPAGIFDIDGLLRATASASAGSRLLLWILLVLAAKSAVTFMWSLFPYRWGRIESDGWLLRALWRGGPDVETRLLLSALRGYSLRRIRPRRWPDDLVSRAVVRAERTIHEHLACLYAYSWALDNGIASAGILLDRAIATCATPKAPPSALALEAAYFEARYRTNVAAARARLVQGKGKGSEWEQMLVARAEAAILLVEGCYQQAEARANAGLAVLLAGRAGDSAVSLPMEAEHLRELMTEAQRRQRAAAGEAGKEAMDT